MPAVPGIHHALDFILKLDDAQIAAIFNNELESAGRSETRYGRWGEQRGPRLGNLFVQQLLHAFDNGRAGHVQPAFPSQLAALIESFKADKELSKVRTVGVESKRHSGDRG